MKASFQIYKTRLLFIAGALFIMTSASPAGAQTSNETAQLLNRIEQLENQVQTMSRAVYRGDKDAAASLAAGAAGADSTAASTYEVRMSQLEDQQRKLTGQLEKIQFDIQQLKDRLDRMQADTDQRFQSQQPPAPAIAPATPSAAPAPAQSVTGTLGTLSEGSSEPASGNGPAETLYEAAFASVRDTKYDDAESKFKQFLSQYPSHPLAANAEYWLGETYYVRGDFKQAAKSFAQGYQDFPKSAKAADSLFKLSLSLAKLDKKDDACLSLRQFQKEYQSAAGPLQRKAEQEIKQLACP